MTTASNLHDRIFEELPGWSHYVFTSGGRQHVKIWRGTGDMRPLIYSADTEVMALTIALHATLEREAIFTRNRSCPKCHGTGQFVSRDGFEHCVHAETITSPSFPDGFCAATNRSEAQARAQLAAIRSSIEAPNAPKCSAVTKMIAELDGAIADVEGK
jgi:hypothetical protein